MTLTSNSPCARDTAMVGIITEDLPSPILSYMTEFASFGRHLIYFTISSYTSRIKIPLSASSNSVLGKSISDQF